MGHSRGHPRRADHPPAELREGRVVQHHGATVIVEDTDGGLFNCNIRKRVGRVVCGDRVRWQPTAEGQGVVVELLPRHGLLTRPDPRGGARPLAANIDQIFVVCAPEPPLSEALIDRYLVAAELAGCAALILVNKSDLLDAAAREALRERLAEFEAIGYPLLFVNSRSAEGLAPLRAHTPGRTSILVGQSGVGKSSLVNALLPDQAVRVGALSAASGLGRHTTSDTTLYHLPDGGDLIDSPGVRDFHLWHIDRSELARGFREFTPFLGQCRFHNCRHINEPGCAIEQAVESGRISPRRLQSYRQIYAQLEEAETRF
ncbi:small ribosomal subunit biogenesis GTPase RsgA [Thiohalobacter sp. IOR34]|uniref:small ribosomal subunit biogenesis GTPase RsgA n=1 Tax=Thiohalobacter sp. IOR34 TaxID=3057176 RepID=UPI0025AF3330|nr:small ribosomal subunit biogenesis GTPase RsgA [Thiohalobacter sp. IOR34]WJW76322.1 small ribosomal subunit biogenesis GTPase RsgA [Thiohalobacter sp. IOR34]